MSESPQSSALTTVDEIPDSHPVAVGEPSYDAGRALFEGKLHLAPLEVQKQALAIWDERRSHFRDWLLSKMEEGIHFGFPPGTKKADKPGWKARASLYQAGAELTCDLLAYEDRYELDLDLWRMMGEPIGTVCVKCSLYRAHTGELVGVGRGTMESAEKGMNVNSRVKMAYKRALVHAVLQTVKVLRDFFTQDMEDGSPQELRKQQERGEREAAKAPRKATEKQLARLCALAHDDRLAPAQRKWIADKLAAPVSFDDAKRWCDQLKAMAMGWRKGDPDPYAAAAKYNADKPAPAHEPNDLGICGVCGIKVEPAPADNDPGEPPPSTEPDDDLELPPEPENAGECPHDVVGADGVCTDCGERVPGAAVE